jgi:hypothetical protein
MGKLQLAIEPLSEVRKRMALAAEGDAKEEDAEEKQRVLTVGLLLNVDAAEMPNSRRKYFSDARNVTSYRIRPDFLKPAFAKCASQQTIILRS